MSATSAAVSSSTPIEDTPTRLHGTLLRVHPDGYGFIHVGTGLPEYWVHRKQVPIVAWFEGKALSFVAGPPKKAGTAPCALDVQAIDQAETHRRPLFRRSPRTGDSHEA